MIGKVLKLEPFPQPRVVTTRYPVLMMHGFGILGSLGRAGQQHNLAMRLRQHGLVAFAPNVAPYSRVPLRAEQWRERLDRILEETRQPRVNIIAHSMGGLDARYLISCLDGHEHVASLTTLGTPHHGTYIAEWILSQPNRLSTWAAGVLDWLGEAAFTELPSATLDAVSEFTPAFVNEEFNSRCQDSPSVKYWSFAGKAGVDTSISVNPVFNITNSVLYRHEGLNDGLVSVPSAEWGTFLGTVEADHARQIGIHVTPAKYNAADFFLSVAEHLRDHEL